MRQLQIERACKACVQTSKRDIVMLPQLGAIVSDVALQKFQHFDKEFEARVAWVRKQSAQP